MDFDLTAEQKEIRALARDFAVSEVAPVSRHFDETQQFPHELMAKLGKHKRGKGCLYINKLDDVDRGVLRKLVEHAIAETRKRA